MWVCGEKSIVRINQVRNARNRRTTMDLTQKPTEPARRRARKKPLVPKRERERERERERGSHLGGCHDSRATCTYMYTYTHRGGKSRGKQASAFPVLSLSFSFSLYTYVYTYVHISTYVYTCARGARRREKQFL